MGEHLLGPHILPLKYRIFMDSGQEEPPSSVVYALLSATGSVTQKALVNLSESLKQL